ncbi:ATP-binding protein [Cellulomonas carbonis]|uniref:Regulatory protein n=1 Tax=Cellulomonas carbonis T26 TaxID=947969 RepID=A0A0A0BTG9_9CELL|nr:ATP-binding protein [Cellulomonas carbonis]KGM11215.1 regulatory protein [Cellulomonas carbonis T26]GGC10783.1 ATP-binding protein [Cellulomonas carbonis]
MSDPRTATLRVDLDPSHGAVRTARHAVVRWARSLGATPVDQEVLALLTTEVVSNAVRHGSSGEDVLLEGRPQPAAVTVRVTDRGHGRPVLRRSQPSELGGRGIDIVDRLSVEWGVDTAVRGKTVWFTVRLGATRFQAGDGRGA